MTLKQLRKRVKFWQAQLGELGLLHWDLHITIVEEPQGRYGNPAHASVQTSQHYDTAWIEFEKQFITDQNQVQIDKIIIHELLHIIMRDWRRVMELPEQMMPPGEYKQWEELLEHEEEGVIERLSRAICMLYHESKS